MLFIKLIKERVAKKLVLVAETPFIKQCNKVFCEV